MPQNYNVPPKNHRWGSPNAYRYASLVYTLLYGGEYHQGFMMMLSFVIEDIYDDVGIQKNHFARIYFVFSLLFSFKEMPLSVFPRFSSSSDGL